ncbi:MAG TPA: hypothetical protein VGD90_06530 [Sphingobacteriaceae bacterium]
MDINILVIGLVVIAALVLLVWLIRQNLRDKREFEKNSNLSELKPDLHKSDKI